MTINQVIEVVKLLDCPYYTEELTEKIGYLEIVKYTNDWQEDETSIIYFDKKTGEIIPNYEKKRKIEEQIKELQEELKKL